MFDEPCRQHGFSGVAYGKENRAPEIAVAKKICRDGCSHRADNDRPSCAGPESDQDASGHTGGRPENGNTFRLGQQGKAKPGCQEIDDGDRDSEPDQATPPRQVEPGGLFVLNLCWSLRHPVLLPQGACLAQDGCAVRRPAAFCL
jgi:hypothetical protein